MASRTAKVASSIVAGFLAGAPLTAPHDAANAADCVTTPPRQEAPQGQHWYYRIDHANNKRHCWYLREEGGKASQAVPTDDASQAPGAVTPSSETATRSLEDAHAEYPVPQPRTNIGGVAAQMAPAAAPGTAQVASNPPASPAQGGAQDDTQGSSVAARWPSLAAAAPAPVASDPAEPSTEAAPPPPAATPAAQPPAVEKPSASLQMLFAVIIGALALAGLTASIVYRLGRGRRLDPRQRRAAIWEGVESGPRPPWVEPAIAETSPRPSPTHEAAAVAVAPERYQKIEEILAQLVRQAQQSDA
jgi:hypothetical protein